MRIGGMRVRIVFQMNETAVDKYGNHMAVWTDYFSCWATASAGHSSEETSNAASTQEADKLDFTVRWCTEIAEVNSKQYRILAGNRIYNITGIDEMGFRHNSRKFHVELTER